ncbi:MAG: replicative DNA helicase [Acidobacteriota bacterium]|nr:replicative DNA helicase [Acidobacteriota bacterium]
MLETLTQPQTLPKSEEAERAVLAAVLLEPSMLPLISARLTSEDFYLERHRLVYQAMLDLQEGGTHIDLRTLQGGLEERMQLEAAGGLAYLASLDIDLPDLSRVDSYAEIVKERSVRRRLVHAATETIRDCLEGGMVAEEALAKAEQTILGLGEESISRGFSSIGAVLEETVHDLEDRPGASLIGVPTGFREFDRITHGLNKGNLIIVAGRPGMGKTSLALNIAQHVAMREDRSVGIFSLEMSEQELALRMLCAEADISFTKLRSGLLSNQQWSRVHDAVRRTEHAPLFIDDSPNPTLLELSSKSRRLKAEKGLDVLILDYLQLMQAGGRYENRNLEIAAISRGLKQLAKELEIPVIALSQLSRNPERRTGDHRPQLSDLRESGAIEQDADMVCFVYRDEVYHPDDPEKKGLAELIIAKHRNGETGSVPLIFLGEVTSFKNPDPDGFDAAPPLDEGAPPF